MAPAENQADYDPITLKWGTLEEPREKNGKSTIKFYEREGNVETGEPKIIEGLISIKKDSKVRLNCLPRWRSSGVATLRLYGEWMRTNAFKVPFKQ